jgi:hypothetical protein
LTESATVVSFLSKKLEGESYRDTIRKAAFMGFTELPNLGRLDGDADSERARELLLKWAKPPHPMESRVGAIVALGAVLKKASAAVREVILETFNELIDETDYRLHGALIMVLGDSDCPGADALLSRIRRSSVTTWMDAHSEFALKSLEARRSSPERLDDLKKQLDELKHETQALKDQVKGSP